LELPNERFKNKQKNNTLQVKLIHLGREVKSSEFNKRQYSSRR